MSNQKKIIRAFSIWLFYFQALHFTCPAEELDAKSVPKQILMLGLYCNDAILTLKGRFEANPSAPPWRAEGPRKEAILTLMQKLDLQDFGLAKAVKDKALTSAETQFLKFSAVHEADQWLNNINKSCSNPEFSPEYYDTCLKEANSEIYKCYRQITDGAQVILNARGIK
jgi:hypothetical protein